MMDVSPYTLPANAPNAWYPRPETLPGVLSEIAEIAGVPAALSFGATYGHQRKYIPAPDTIGQDHWLAQAIGIKPARLLAHRHAGESIVFPAASTERRAIAVLRLFLRGYAINKIVAKLNVSRAQVKRITDKLPRPSAETPAEQSDGRCPVCGRRHGGGARKHHADDERQLFLPLPSGDRSTV